LAGRIGAGKAIVNLLNLADGERVAAILPVSYLDVENSDKTIMMVTSSGRIKKTDMQEFSRPLRRGKKPLPLTRAMRSSPLIY